MDEDSENSAFIQHILTEWEQQSATRVEMDEILELMDTTYTGGTIGDPYTDLVISHHESDFYF